jgi:hypothetical protein
MNNLPIFFLLKVNQKREIVDSFVNFLSKLNFTHVETFYLDDKEYEVLLTADSIQNLTLVQNMKYTENVWFGADYLSTPLDDELYMDDSDLYPDDADIVFDCENCDKCKCKPN